MGLKAYQQIVVHTIDGILLLGLLIILKGYGTDFGW